jgi:GT2 family glycosyltransferase
VKIKVHRAVRFLDSAEPIPTRVNAYIAEGFSALCVIDLRTAEGAGAAMRYVGDHSLPICIIPGATVTLDTGVCCAVYGAVDRVVVPSGLSFDALKAFVQPHGGFVELYPVMPHIVEIEVDRLDSDEVKRSLASMKTSETPLPSEPNTSKKRVDIIIPVHNQLSYLKNCMDALRQNTASFNLIVVNDGSDRDTKRWLRKERRIDKLIEHKTPLGFGRSCNEGLRATVTSQICLLNSDTIVTPHWMSVMEGVLQQGFDIVGPTTSHSSGEQCDHSMASKRHSMDLDELYSIGETRARLFGLAYMETPVFGFCMMFTRRVIERIGGFDWHRYADGYYEDTDFVWRAQQADFRSAWAKGAYVHHYGATSFVERIGWPKINELSARNKLVYKERQNHPDDLYFAFEEGKK